jgi:hypothetical protein
LEATLRKEWVKGVKEQRRQSAILGFYVDVRLGQSSLHKCVYRRDARSALRCRPRAV